ncbi:M4 family metallopeptidase [Halobacillus shinanisalinarum]|uniref:Neutral metalloproteinase n=1 Tax=Halobacillus shinanisalinarum TaxID=2932258 RepID=A0ABY4H4F7_9BACI|nr:M4 family metallopeptidase [Halobacillus shinanisalinarum]UOQ95244.1 M4 family metallopeptidase [Halobacillus shinanisalinarum]
MNWKSFMASVVIGSSLFSGGSLAHAETGSTDQTAPQAKINAPDFVKKNFSASKVVSKEKVSEFFKENAKDFGINPNKDLKFVKAEQDDLGMTHYTYQPLVENIPVANSKVIVHTNKDGTVASVNGEFHKNAPEKLKQQRQVKKKEALSIAWTHIDVEKEEADQTKKTAEGENFETLTEASNLVVYHENGNYQLAYHVELQFAQPYPANWQVYINAESGEVIKAANLVNEATGTGVGVLGNTKSLNTYYTNNTYYLFDTTKPMNGVIETFTGNNGEYLPGNYVTDTGNTFYSEQQKAAVDAHYYAGEVFDYYYDTFGRVSYDDQGADIRSTVHYGSNYNNAAWTGNQMIYGDGDGSTFTYLSGADDVVAHELTHAVTDTTAQLVYENQSGALNESFSDVFGYFVDSEDWLMGEDVYTPGRRGDALRSMSNPNAYNQPDHMNEYQNLPNTREGDWGGVHTNSGIPNKAAYYTINNLGISKTEQIYYRALTVYLTPSSDFSYAKAALEQSANDIYGNQAANAVTQAWNNVGVY